MGEHRTGETLENSKSAVKPAAAVKGAPVRGKEPEIDSATLREAEKLACLRYTETERRLALELVPELLGKYRARRAVPLENGDPPAVRFEPHLHTADRPVEDPVTVKLRRTENPRWNFIRGDEEYIAFAPVWVLSRWIRRREISCRELTELYLSRLKKYGERLSCVVTLTEKRALEAAERADAELRRGVYRGPLHGIPWGAKDLLDTKGIPTTWGANPYRHRVPEHDAAVVRRLDEAGAVLVAKLSLGALAYGDVWFGGKTKNPWNLKEGSSGSSAGSAAATAAGLVAFSLGTETYGSIVSPCMTCGVTGLRPTFGRVPRTGAMALAWSFDKIGPIARSVEDAAVVLASICGADPGDPDSVDVSFSFDAGADAKGLRIGYNPAWFDGAHATEVDRRALETLAETGAELVEVNLPDLPYETLGILIDVEAAAAFEELTLSDRDDLMVRQDKESWPNIFRTSRLIPAVEYLQVQRFRRRVIEVTARIFANVDLVISPSYAADLLLITNATGHPSLTIPAGFTEDGKPYGITLWGRLFDEGTLCRAGLALERRLGMWNRYPPLR